MRQETGSNPISSNKKVSIQVKLGGRSFSAESYAALESSEQIEFVINTPRATLVPREEISLDVADDILRIAGKPCYTTEQSVCSDLQNTVVAAIAIDRQALESIISKWGKQASFSTPLLDMRHSDKTCLTIDVCEKVCYMRIFNDGLQRAEAFDAATVEDVLYLTTEWLNGNNIPIYIKGSAEAAKLLNKYYKQVICE